MFERMEARNILQPVFRRFRCARVRRVFLSPMSVGEPLMQRMTAAGRSGTLSKFRDVVSFQVSNRCLWLDRMSPLCLAHSGGEPAELR